MSRIGITEWQNPNNGLYVCRLHHTADPFKRTAEWIAATKRNLPKRGYDREYDISWTTPEGEPVTPEYGDTIHCRKLTVIPGQRGLAMWDFGYVSPVVLFGQLTIHNQLHILRELCPFNTPLADLIPMAKAVMLNLFGITPVVHFGDPAGENQTDLGSSVQVLQLHGIRIHATRPGTEISYAKLRERLRTSVYIPGIGQEPTFLIDPLCQNTREALGGAFHLSPHPPYRVVKVHPYKDCVDALRYGNDNLSREQTTFYADMHKMAHIDMLEIGP